MVVIMATLVVSSRLTPIYEATATIDIDRQTPSDVVGQDSVRSAPGDADQFLATQMKLVESDSVLRPVDQKFGLRTLEGQSASDGSKGQKAPVVLKRLRVTRPPNTYLMLIQYQSTDPQLAADAANAISQSYLELTYNIRVRSSESMAGFMEHQLEELKAKMERSGTALAAFERELNLVNPEEKTNILASRLLQLNSDYTSAQGDRLRKQAAYESVRGGELEAVLATPQGEALRKLSERANEAREHFAEIKAFYGANHAEYRKAQAAADQIQVAFDATRADIVRRVEIEFRESERREQMSADAVATAKTEFDRVNGRSFEYQALKREADGDKTLYDELMRRIKEAGINAGFHNSAIRIADAARPPLKPVFPNIPLNALLAFLFSGLIGIGGAVIADLLDKTIRDPEQVSRTLRTEVIGSLPLMKSGGEKRMLSTNDGETAAAVQERESSGFAESVRTLRNSILLANFNRRYRSLLVTSAAPSEGKTTTAAHLAAAHAEQGHRTLLIDGDLRRPSIHRNFNLPSSIGLSNVLLGEMAWRDAVISVATIAALDVLPAGPPSRRAGDLVGRGIVELLDEATAEYDLVVLDAPPLLGFAEPLQMATAVDGVIIVARAGQTSRKAVASVLATLNRLRANVIGLVLNEVHKNLSDSYYYYGYYRSYYRPHEENDEAEMAKHKEVGV
jgi:capsular exopolysaccharide synthesis family protein